MIKIERNPVAPPSLAVEEKKKNGSYREKDVLEQLATDFYGKCYICEIKPVQDPQVEHRLPHHNRKIIERVFNWNNLFYSCSHCNSVKNSRKYDNGIIDCCIRDPEKILLYQVTENTVKVKVKDPSDSEGVLTAELIEEVFNTTSTGIRTQAGDVRLRELQKTLNAFYAQLQNYQQNPMNSKTVRSLKAFLNKESKFSGFIRSYAREHGYEELFYLD